MLSSFLDVCCGFIKLNKRIDFICYHFLGTYSG